MAKRIGAIILIYVGIALAWMVLGGMTYSRSYNTFDRLSNAVAGLWGDVQVQMAPELSVEWITIVIDKETVTDPKTGRVQTVEKQRLVRNSKPVLIDSSDIDVGFDLEHRKKGLLWYSTYVVDFNADYAYTHRDEMPMELVITYRFPTTQASYDDFQFSIDGEENPTFTPVSSGYEKIITQKVPVEKGQRVPFTIAYKTRGLDYWRYTFGQNVNRIKDFTLVMKTNFDAIDFPENSMSPNDKEKIPGGWLLTWQSNNIISGFDIGMVMPKKLNPGPLAAQISLFAPVCLLFFFVWLFVIALLKKVDLHPMHYLFMGAAFFVFHLLLTYTVDHIPLLWAFGISSAVSVFLVVSYLRLAVGMRFAAVEAGLAQVVYLVLFSYAHFYQGWTGLMVTIGSIMTLFVIMQLTGKINWTEKFARNRPPSAPRPGPIQQGIPAQPMAGPAAPKP